MDEIKLIINKCILTIVESDKNDVNTLQSLDSLSFIKLVVELEQIFEIEFDDEMLSVDNFQTIDELSNYILNKKNFIP
jgi:Phosphopantetheine attachment site.